jgi:glycosyltransferase involved in cell wall biosynthesis
VYRVLFLTTEDGTFVTKDKEILKQQYEVTHLNIDLRTEPHRIVELIHEIRAHDLVFGWFITPTNSIATILASVMNTPTILIAGGYDVARVPKIGYGLTLDKKYYYLTKISLCLADRVLAVSNSNKKEVLRLCSVADVNTIYVGAVDTETFCPDRAKKEPDLVLSVGTIKESNLRKKGLKYFAQASRICEDKRFVLIGEKRDSEAVKELVDIAGNNFHMPGYVSYESLLDYYKRAKVYVQPSIHESFGVSVAEAMACECVPVVARNGALPEVVGDTGVYLDGVAPTQLKNAIEEASTMDGAPARERVVEKFRRERRSEELLQQISSLL